MWWSMLALKHLCIRGAGDGRDDLTSLDGASSGTPDQWRIRRQLTNNWTYPENLCEILA